MRVLLLALLLAGPAVAEPVPLCGQPQVLALVAERLSRAGLPPVFEPAAIGQAQAGPDLVECAVRLRPPGLVSDPASAAFTYRYALRLRRNAVFMLPDPR